ncbi:hypothetical protein MLD38_033055 [Melastoma candidum]|uniref:Uncharacterized protein n=1 Tax=Melastoma candidum TaxID=119954 RepID=A0ACB9M9W0_9MYRT|nr:hypothetical protein MLD38_033055 [Melastoma candidum]
MKPHCTSDLRSRVPRVHQNSTQWNREKKPKAPITPYEKDAAPEFSSPVDESEEGEGEMRVARGPMTRGSELVIEQAKVVLGITVSPPPSLERHLVFRWAVFEISFTDTNYTELTELYGRYKDKGLEILAFPCNQFLKQEPGTSEEAAEFVCKRYKAEYPIFRKVHCNGPKTDPVFRFLKSRKTGLLGTRIGTSPSSSSTNKAMLSSDTGRSYLPCLLRLI